MPDKISVLICLLGESDWRIAPVKLRVECSARQPLPVSDITSCFVVDKPLLKDFRASFPCHIATASCQKASYCMSCQIMNPAFHSELSHDGIYIWKSSPPRFSTLEPLLRNWTVDGIVASDETVLPQLTSKVPRNKSAMTVSLCLFKRLSQLRLCTEVHVSEE